MRGALLSTIVMFSTCASAQVAEIPQEYLSPKYVAPNRAPADIIIANSDEPGDRLLVTGHVTDGKMPIKSASVYAFHTDTNGHYATDGNDTDGNARLHGALRTDTAGHYSYSTIRPGSYGGPTHVHYVVTAAGYKTALRELWFADDKILVERRKAGQPEIPKFYPAGAVMIRSVTLDEQGTWHCTDDIVLERK